ncbi:MAG: bifunctional metallophosphatase/5'-nucleotidase [Bacteroidaceae bacterium]|nr:bifunctional metallophosphatase/5'-nucleotidase [Bacteroidaceae bacterium]
MKRFLLPLCALLLPAATLTAQEITLRVIETSDIHGNYLSHDYLTESEARGGLARVAAYVKEQREFFGDDRVLLFDCGDILQGQPSAYFYNYEDTVSTHLAADALNYLRYDAATVGNHDIETGHAVYDRWVRQCQHPVVCANVLDTRTGKPYWPPYAILKRGNLRIAVIGMLTPTVPKWLPEELWAHLQFADIASTARAVLEEVKEKEQPDVIIGLMHTGAGSAEDKGTSVEHAALQVAHNVPGFDLILYGHDHRAAMHNITTTNGRKVSVINPGANGEKVAVADMTINKGRNRYFVTGVNCSLIDIARLKPEKDFTERFAPQHDAVTDWCDRAVCLLDTTISSRDAFFGPSAYVDLIHRMQLDITGADISFAAPLSFDARLTFGTLRVRDMFQLYRYENRLYTLRLTGREIRGYLEASYDGWVNTMHSASDPMLYLRDNPGSYKEGWQRLVTPSYNFDSAAGLRYTVDLRKSRGQRVSIEGLADGRTFDDDATYTVAVNSYRANGGGDLLTEGAGIPTAQLQSRIVKTTERDLRHDMAERLAASTAPVHPTPLTTWRFVPEDWAKAARAREEGILFK